MSTKRPKKVDHLTLAEAVAAAVDIVETRLLETNAHCFADGDQRPTSARVAYRAEVKADVQTNRVLVKVRFILSAGEAPTGSQVGTVHIDATFGLGYKVPDVSKFTQPQLVAFAELNGVYNAWPYWREYVYSTLARMGLPPLVMPVFRIGQQAALAPDRAEYPKADPPKGVGRKKRSTRAASK